MKNLSLCSRFVTITILTFLLTSRSSGQNNQEAGLLGKAELYQAKKTALDYLSASTIIERFGNISDSIWKYAELGMQEFKSSALLIKTLEEEGFKVEKNVAGIPTCFVATWGSGKPVIGILGEFDALPGLSQKALSPVKDPIVVGAPGHGCGHNMMGTAAIAAAIAVKKCMEQNNVVGTIKFFGSPAEETLISRPYMVRAGVFKDVDAVVDNHASSDFSVSYGTQGSALMSAIFSFKGKTAHAAGAPWNGRSALDGVELMDIAANFLREHLYTSHRLHYVIIDGGDAPNVVPDKASVWYYVRETDERLEETFNRVVNCAKGAAIASGTTLDSINILTAIHQRHLNKVLAETIQRNVELIGLPQWTEQEEVFAKALQKELGVNQTGYPKKIKPMVNSTDAVTGGGSSDVAEVTMITPTATVYFPGEVPGEINHNWSTVACGVGSAAWKGLNAGAKVMAGTAIDLLTKPKLLEEIKNQFAEDSKVHPYKSFLPAGAKPPLNLNKEMMDKYRSAMMQIRGDEK